ncbi:TPA: diacylglyceryl transferase [Candidatus Uhrbacteria bacterium]|uniref:Phosphatidylglycerol--prolipoprotein diacylglyceryl transferase n=2 Tax=Candidatus Uhriibacteriota TaxID=1752732 RepID=A0A0G1T7C6_9BACT|nr:MAG: Prolipoprotein diacylglyceryl transferase [Candidatus Uhrbacteria bacterium GW2011_GWF2_46_218]KKU41320.1 MAG: Prolipoprotein diacylglyceryl transferase [Candidatus Uhrbacteria bacterium GW2011_GWE2_46_68]HBK33757.1 diacylglyceryl transferase [Candidatus Uhrbacteria bacterium]HCB19402.1 diacylglyceryl transferase [Candidatus Uhrbacteria bacterium]
MIPYFSLETISLGPITVQVWGLLVAFGIGAGAWVSQRVAIHRGLPSLVFWHLVLWIMIGAFVGARIFFVALYAPAYFFSHPFEVFAIWEGGWSMMGGYLGALAAGAFIFYRKHLSFFSWVDVLIYGLPLGIGIGRIGCFLIHDHPGTPTNFFLGVLYPDGMIRHDHGLYLSLIGFVVFSLFWIMKKYPRRVGDYVFVFLGMEGISRFLLDFLRATDIRYFGLTPAQYLGVIFLGCAVWLFARRSKQPFV